MSKTKKYKDGCFKFNEVDCWKRKREKEKGEGIKKGMIWIKEERKKCVKEQIKKRCMKRERERGSNKEMWKEKAEGKKEMLKERGKKKG